MVRYMMKCGHIVEDRRCTRGARDTSAGPNVGDVKTLTEGIDVKTSTKDSVKTSTKTDTVKSSTKEDIVKTPTDVIKCNRCNCSEIMFKINGVYDRLEGRVAECNGRRVRSRWDLPGFIWRPEEETDLYFYGNVRHIAGSEKIVVKHNESGVVIERRAAKAKPTTRAARKKKRVVTELVKSLDEQVSEMRDKMFEAVGMPRESFSDEEISAMRDKVLEIVSTPTEKPLNISQECPLQSEDESGKINSGSVNIDLSKIVKKRRGI